MLNRLARAAAAALLAVGAPFVATSHAYTFSQLYVFGDSLSDPGNAAALTEVVPGVPGLTRISAFPPSSPSGIPDLGLPYNYRFSNGPVAAEYLSGFLGIAPSVPAWPAAPGNANSNFAVGGAMSGAGPINGANPIVPNVPPALQGLCCNFNSLVNNPPQLAAFPDVLDTGMNNQVALFASRLGSGDIAPFDPASTLFSLWGGPNDVFLALALAAGLPPADQMAVLQAYTINAALNIGTRIGELATLNAENFLVINMPNLGQTPFAAQAGLTAELTLLSIAFNTVLDSTLDSLRAGLGLTIIEFDSFGALGDLIAGGPFSNVTEPCFDEGDVAGSLPRIIGGCQGYLFFDGVHPTTATHQILAAQLYREIPEPGGVALILTGLLALTVLRRLTGGGAARARR